jgi:NAD(P)-dependent dehydrogenase (short-subunit alcohol dehydrogenase family)
LDSTPASWPGQVPQSWWARNRALGEAAATTLQWERCNVRYLSIDLDDPATIAASAQEIEADFGHLDILVNKWLRVALRLQSV